MSGSIVRKTCLGDVFWEMETVGVLATCLREMETVGVCNTCLRDAETLNVLGHRPLSHGACGVSVTPVFPFTYGPSEFQGALIQTVRVLVLFCFVYATVQRPEVSA